MRVAVLALLAGCQTLFPLEPSKPPTDGSPPPSELVVHLTFDDASDLDRDEGGHPVECLDGQCPTQVLDRNNTLGAASFDGASCLSVEASGDQDVSPLTYALWARIDVLPAAGTSTMFARAGNLAHAFQVSVTPGGIWTAGIADVALGQLVPTGEWHHLAAVHDGGNIEVYLDGTLIGRTATNSPTYTGAPTTIGCDLGAVPEELLTGAIDDVRLYNRELSLPELQQLATF